MSNARKLQTEIDRVMKKVDEGVELFDEIWEKVYSAEQQNQKEKYEMDLKKEIKKLQRLRDQIKTWIGSSEVKDKDALLEARRLIETKMEQFKICEKETKTKTYSKEGLAREERLDPAEEAKLRTTSWIAEYVERFQEVLEEKEFELEKLSVGKGKKQNKHQIEGIQAQIANHKFHLSKLEGIIRLVNNDRLDVEPVDALKEDLDYYLDSCEDEDYRMAYDEDFFYESLGLEELDLVNVDRVTQASSVTSKKSDDASSESSSKDKKTGKKSTVASVIPMTIGRARAKSEKILKEEPEKAPATPAKAGLVGRSSSVVSNNSNSVPLQTQAPPVPVAVRTAPQPVQSAAPGASMAAILKRETEQQEKERLKQQQLKQQEQLRQQQHAAQLKQQEQLRQQQEALRLQQQQQQQQQQAAQEALLRQQQEEALRQQQQQAAAAAAAQQKAQQEAAAKQAAAQLQAQQQAAAAEQKAAQSLQNQQIQSQNIQRNNALDILASGLGGLSLGAPESRAEPAPVPMSSTHSGSANVSAALEQASTTYLSALNDSFVTAPSTLDNERSRQYAPQNPYPTPGSYPSSQSAIFDNPAIFEKLGTDCLFFIFYYAQGTYQQYLAARELKKQSWRFHKKYMTWFQRHEEPKITTDEYEQGTYVYFDYETGWCTRIKTDFRFEYSYLEDSLQ